MNAFLHFMPAKNNGKTIFVENHQITADTLGVKNFAEILHRF